MSDVGTPAKPNKREAHERIARARTLLEDADALVRDISFVDERIDTDSRMATARARIIGAGEELERVGKIIGQEDDGVRVFERRFSFDEALAWQLYQKALSWELVDQAEASVAEEVEGFREMEAESRITVEGGMFVVRFYVSAEDLEQQGEE
jgi:hypothetical protein